MVSPRDGRTFFWVVLVTLSLWSRFAAAQASDLHAPIRPAFADVTAPSGFLQPDGNGVLNTSEAFIFLVAQGQATDVDRRHFVGLIRSVQVEPGLINRKPGDRASLEGWDDYVGMVAASRFLGGEAQVIADEVLAYGIRHGFAYNNVQPGNPINDGGLGPWIGRYPYFAAHLFWSARQMPPRELMLAWAAGILWEAKGIKASNNFGDMILQWIIVRSAPKRLALMCPECEVARKEWDHHFMERFHGGIQELIRAYSHPPDEPLIALAAAPPEVDLDMQPLTAFQEIAEIAQLLVAIAQDAAIVLANMASIEAQKVDEDAKKLAHDADEALKRMGSNLGHLAEHTAKNVDRIVAKMVPKPPEIPPVIHRPVVVISNGARDFVQKIRRLGHHRH